MNTLTAAAFLVRCCFAHPPYPPAPVRSRTARRGARKNALTTPETRTPGLRGTDQTNGADHYEVPRPLVHRLAIRRKARTVQMARNGPFISAMLQILPANRTRTWAFCGDAEANFEILMSI